MHIQLLPDEIAQLTGGISNEASSLAQVAECSLTDLCGLCAVGQVEVDPVPDPAVGVLAGDHHQGDAESLATLRWLPLLNVEHFALIDTIRQQLERRNTVRVHVRGWRGGVPGILKAIKASHCGGSSVGRACLQLGLHLTATLALCQGH